MLHAIAVRVHAHAHGDVGARARIAIAPGKFNLDAAPCPTLRTGPKIDAMGIQQLADITPRVPLKPS
ncbi:hypothetical protein BN2476_320077 [Paraburkholderia piptadeniae]|uniref:Uncharacterized protein n=1 Tax=Paraburkholderia piptadeniae TaxID=1701573 RepID=A0A1N7S5U3_9BURK|nr:hypothetical protein BN2476_320077 [Paraburkholderia piptadeniae]